ncbi:aldehyde oxidase [Sesbania bispinosa]|nr:aldehyde oxidase [Sesbania bispinosa]
MVLMSSEVDITTGETRLSIENGGVNNEVGKVDKAGGNIDHGVGREKHVLSSFKSWVTPSRRSH